ncbi:hypothetical protein [Dyella caseinilytica]|uniref:Uncharacterized protein n=1 Tax=Dyella caseinilytica TaxID=1849581 RepID=A0ABX7GXK7_9GAMM|nr:hypothetical protein [Dyella caseinilytica]QRN55211.1 hypothetical protein ISN74_07745 [Dyella caseinilytica]GGA00149.1 hypothetical protein GCM10011408_21240 [Dyella caseinilytica]
MIYSSEEMRAIADRIDAENMDVRNSAIGTRYQASAMLRAFADERKKGAPERWKLVPIELTKNMEHVALYVGGIHNVKKAWDAMLAAAPTYEWG